MDRKVIFLDIDGTLTLPGDTVVPQSALAAIRAAQAKGNRVFLCSGRNFNMVKPLLKYGFDGVSSSAGGYIVSGREVIYDHPLDGAQLKRIRELFDKGAVNYAVETMDAIFGNEGFNARFNDVSGKKFSSELDLSRPMADYDGRPAYKVIFLCGEEDALKEARRALSGEFHFCMGSLPIPGTVNGELISRAFNKGLAVERVCARLGIPVSDSVGFGDSTNDMELIETAGTGVCMGNGCEELKKVSDLICPPVDRDGLAWAFCHLGLS